MEAVPLPRSFYEGDDVVQIARELLGKHLCTLIGNELTTGKIVETEAYCGRSDNACHSHIHGYTERTRIMFGEPGYAYIYLCYGIHHLFNVVTNVKGKADAVLIRAIEPVSGIDTILARRNKKKLDRAVGGGPGIVSQALGITTSFYGSDLCTEPIWIEDKGIFVPEDQILASPRVGVDYAGVDAQLPWRFRIKNNRFTSPAR